VARDRYPLTTLMEAQAADEEAARGALVLAEAALEAARAEAEAAMSVVRAVATMRAAAPAPRRGRALELDAFFRWRDRLTDEDDAARTALRARVQAVRQATATVETARANLAEAAGRKQATARHEETWEREQRKEAARREERET
jgi:hypothetical protein